MRLYLLSSLLILPILTFGQINIKCDESDSHSIYVHDDSSFYRIDYVDSIPSPLIKIADNPFSLGGIAICNNLDLANGKQTLYYTDKASKSFYYWNGTDWINSHHSIGSSGAINPGGTANYIFNLDGNSDSLYRYDGKSDATLLLPNLYTYGAAVYDVATDNQGNFYLFFAKSEKIRVFNVHGILVDSFTTSGFPDNFGPGFAIIGDRMYAIALDSGLYEGIPAGKQINFTLKEKLPIAVSDIAVCPKAGNSLLPHFIICPNPALDFTTVKLYGVDLLEIYDCLGRRIKIANTQGLSEYNLHINGWVAEVYFIKAWNNNRLLGCSPLVVQ